MSTDSMRQSASKSRYDDDRSHTDAWTYCLQLGLFAGVLWGGLRWILYSIHFTIVLPGFLAEPFMRHSFLKTAWGQVAGIAAFILFSIVAVILYRAILGRFKGPYAGLIYGAVWWWILFLGIGPAMDMMLPVTKLGWNSVLTEFCVFLLWGLFIGYSYAFEFTDEASREPYRQH
ncbi:YqhR family membrane protein [Paenibacillus tarimensis]